MSLPGREPYLTLMASLPALPPPFGGEQLPISRRRLESRLEMLREADARLLARIEAAVHWDRLGMDKSDTAWTTEARALLKDLPAGALGANLAWRFDVRTLVGALRRRAAGAAAPARGAPFGVSTHAERLRRHWDAPDFGLAGAHPWLPQALALHAAGDTLGLERLLVELVWRRTARDGERYAFDFPAVVFYVLRWHLLQRWASYDRPAARRRFAVLLDEALAGPGAAALDAHLAEAPA